MKSASANEPDAGFSDLLAAFPNGSVAIFDRHLRYVVAGGRGLATVGLTPRALVGKTLQDVFPSDSVLDVEPQYRRAFDGHEVVFRFTFFQRVYSISAAPYRLVDGEVVEIMVVAQDITLLVPPVATMPGETNTELQAQLDADERLMGALGHELRNPLSAMAAAISVVQHSEHGSARERACAVLQRQVQFVARLTDTLLDVSLARRGVLPLHFQSVDLQSLLADAVEAVQQRGPSPGPTMQLRLRTETALWVRADHQRLTQVVTNLVSNAVRHTPADGTVLVRCDETDDAVLIAVEDNGTGIEPAELRSVFEPFRRGAVSSGAGLGLGLWLSRQIVLLHGGEIGAASAGPGTGATFTVRLPLALVVASPVALHDRQ